MAKAGQISLRSPGIPAQAREGIARIADAHALTIPQAVFIALVRAGVLGYGPAYAFVRGAPISSVDKGLRPKGDPSIRRQSANRMGSLWARKLSPILSLVSIAEAMDIVADWTALRVMLFGSDRDALTAADQRNRVGGRYAPERVIVGSALDRLDAILEGELVSSDDVDLSL